VRVYLCLTQEHDLRLVVLAALICLFGSYTVMSLIQRALAASDSVRLVWLSTGAVATGGSIWATHFVAMLAYGPGMPTGFELGPTVLSIVVAIAVTGIGLGVAVGARDWPGRCLGGAIVGLGIDAMHYTGMAALRVPALVGYDPFLVALSLLLAIAFGALSLHVALQRPDLLRRSLGALLLVIGICALHFTAMGALELTPSPLVPLPKEGMIAPALLASAIAGVTVLLLAFSLAGSILDQHLANRTAREATRLQDLVNATFEGIAIHAGGRLLDANAALAELIGYSVADMIGRDVLSFVAPEHREQARQRIVAASEEPYEVDALHADGRRVPVEILGRAMDYKGKRVRVAAIRDITERRNAEAAIRFMATHDALTELPNRVLFRDRLEQELVRARRIGEKVAVLCLDLDRFKDVNDLRGHGAGDRLLKQVATRLTAAVRETDTVARLGGDEFALVQSGLSQPEGAAAFAERLVASVAEPFDLDGEGMVIGLSIGIALFPADGEDADTLLRNADTALYRAKADGRGTYRMFEPAMDARLQARRALEYDLRQALVQQQFEVYYQPQAETRSKQITGFEALVRWRHPKRGMIAPGDFIPLAEETGLIVPLGEWVLRTACADAVGWPEHLRVCVNLSPVQFARGGLADLVEKVVRAHRLTPQRLELEITEGVLIKDSEQTLEILLQLKGLGVRIAMDDFGTGYSSLGYLQRFPFDKIKIDQSFIRALGTDADSLAIVRAVIGLGRSLRMPVIAEGVETEEQLALLRREQCDGIQGYLIGEPMPLKSFAADYAGLAPSRRAREAAGVRDLSPDLVLAQSRK
jgi:diguanylate cyclase (GGDEF)-like protein/PAS domain S-box-containing protein